MGRTERGGVGRPSTTSRSDRFTSICGQLGAYLIHTRPIPNGMDFLFSGPEVELHQTLELLASTGSERRRGLRIDYVRVDEYFLLRLVGPERTQRWIRTLFP